MCKCAQSNQLASTSLALFSKSDATALVPGETAPPSATTGRRFPPTGRFPFAASPPLISFFQVLAQPAFPLPSKSRAVSPQSNGSADPPKVPPLCLLPPFA